ncbi:hypothetical protein GGI21_001861, partial [Coemansia aciculifera]
MSFLVVICGQDEDVVNSYIEAAKDVETAEDAKNACVGYVRVSADSEYAAVMNNGTEVSVEYVFRDDDIISLATSDRQQKAFEASFIEVCKN